MSCRFCSPDPNGVQGVLVYKSYPSLQRILARHPKFQGYQWVWIRDCERKLKDKHGYFQDVVVDDSIPDYEWNEYGYKPTAALVDWGAQICHVS